MTEERASRPEVTVEDAERMVARGMAMLLRDDMDGALAEFITVDDALRYTPDPAARVQWARAINGLGFIQLMDAKAQRPEAPDLDDDAAKKFWWELKKALACFEHALAVQSDGQYRPYVQGNKAYVLALLGRDEQAGALFEDLFRALGREAYQGQVDDTLRQPIPEDQAVRRLLDTAWEFAQGGREASV